jgi:DNA-binding transcriptional LysR family regulator
MVDVRECSPMPWSDLEAFLAVAREGSHAKAGKALGVDPTTVGRRLAALEGELGARLFDRTPAGLVPTSAGRALVPRAERVEAELVAAARELSGADTRARGAVRLTSGDGVVRYVLVPALASLRAEHPALEVELRAETRMLDLSRREADVAVRLVRPKEPGLVARRLGAMAFGLFASQAYLSRRGTPRSTRDLAGHDWIGFEPALDRLPQNRWLAREVPGARRVVRANTTAVQVAACAEGLGLALFPLFVAPHEPRLVHVLPHVGPPAREAWAVTHADLRGNARVRAVLDWLGALFET